MSDYDPGTALTVINNQYRDFSWNLRLIVRRMKEEGYTRDEAEAMCDLHGIPRVITRWVLAVEHPSCKEKKEWGELKRRVAGRGESHR